MKVFQLDIIVLVNPLEQKIKTAYIALAYRVERLKDFVFFIISAQLNI